MEGAYIRFISGDVKRIEMSRQGVRNLTQGVEEYKFKWIDDYTLINFNNVESISFDEPSKEL